jgi:Secretion system C-terminal sorting domain
MGKTITAVVSVLSFILLTIMATSVDYSQEAKNNLLELHHPENHLLPVGRAAKARLQPFFPGPQRGSLNTRGMHALTPFAKTMRSSKLKPARSTGEANYVIDTVIAVNTYDTTRYTFGHDASATVTSISVNKWMNGQWVDSCRYFYAAVGYELTQVLEQWTNSQWTNVDSVTYTFDVEGYELAQVDEQWTNGSWVKVDSVSYTYDGLGNVYSVLEDLWTNGQWVNDWRDTYAYDEYGNTSSVLEELWTNGQWVNHLRYENITDANGYILSGVTETWLDNQWVNVGSTAYTYYGSGRVFTEVNQQWGNSQWVNVDSTIDTYSGSGQLLTQTEEHWTNNQWVNFDSTAYAYDMDGNSLTQLDEQWTADRWTNVDLTSYVYDPNGLETSAKHEIWKDSLWIPADGNLYFSDGVGDYSYYNECTITTIYANTATGVVSDAAAIPSQFALSQNYPNPFNPSTMIQFTVPSNGHAVLKVFNVLGQELATLFDGAATAGEYHRATFDASRLASGIYFSRLEFGGKMQIKKMMLLK